MRYSIVALAIVLGGPPLAGQMTFRFRYDPAPGRAVRGLTVLRTLTTMQGLPRVPDGTTVETEARIFSHETVTGTEDQGLRVSLGVDSVRVRHRIGESAWVEGDVPPFAGHETRAVVDERLHVVGIETTAPEDGAILRALTAWSANLGFAFPDTAVAVGSTFRTGAQMPFDLALGDEAGAPVQDVLLGDLQLTLDSLVARGADTLAYLRFAGSFAPRTVETSGEDGTRTDTFEGGFAGNLLWSTGWDAFVSAGVRVRVSGRLRQESAGGVLEGTVEWDATLVHRLRP